MPGDIRRMNKPAIMNNYKDLLKFYPDFPEKGVNFVDIFPLIRDKETFRRLTADLGSLCASPTIAAPEARGFLFGTPMLIACPGIESFVPLRKKGKLPFSEGDLVAVDIIKEYGKDQVFYRLSDLAAGKPDGDCLPVTLFDDVLATGGTARGIAESMNRQTVTVDGKTYCVRITDFVFLIEIDGLAGRDLLNGIAPVKSLIHL